MRVAIDFFSARRCAALHLEQFGRLTLAELAQPAQNVRAPNAPICVALRSAAHGADVVTGDVEFQMADRHAEQSRRNSERDWRAAWLLFQIRDSQPHGVSRQKGERRGG